MGSEHESFHQCLRYTLRLIHDSRDLNHFSEMMPLCESCLSSNADYHPATACPSCPSRPAMMEHIKSLYVTGDRALQKAPPTLNVPKAEVRSGMWNPIFLDIAGRSV